jgi:signal transduction histidine kinase
VRLTVSDDGAGFDRDLVRASSLGLATMAERARSAGATLDIQTAPGAGTTVRLEVPA